jgi:uncharacterized protein YdaU (DUF1376 family)
MAYRRLLDAYYQRESPFPDDMRQVYRLTRAQDDEQRQAIDTVLSEFFTLTDEGWRHFRCDAEIQAVSGKREKASQSAKSRWNKAKALQPQCDGNANASFNGCERIEMPCEGNAPNPNPNPNQEQKNTQAPEKSETVKTLKASDLINLGVNEQHAKDWLAVRQKKKAPLTPTAMQATIREAAKAGISVGEAVRVCAERGWQGFNADWLKDSKSGKPNGIHHGFDNIDYNAGLVAREDGTLGL